MLNQKQILQYAIKGITAEIEELEKSVRKGSSLIEKIEKGEQVNTKATKYEILEKVEAKIAKIEKLDKERFELNWQIDVEMNDEN